jgi:hypothetical protein
MATFLSTLANVSVKLLKARLGAWVIVPLERSNLQSKIWCMLRSSQQSGVGGTAIEAALLFANAVGAGGQKRVAQKHRARAWLLDQFASGQSLAVSQIRSNADSVGVTWSSVDRTARDLGILRKKCGFQSGWSWQRPCTSEGK